MPRYEYDPSKASATIEIFPKDSYLLMIGPPKAFAKKETNSSGQDEVKNFGIRFQLTIKEVSPTGDAKLVGKHTILSGYLHNDGSQSMTKRFQMAALGYKNTPEAEKQFDVDQAGKDWSFDPETGAVGQAWAQFGGGHVVGILDVGKNNRTDEPQQNFKSWAPMTTWGNGAG